MPVGVVDEGMRLLAPATKLMYQLIELAQSALDDADDVSCDADVVTDMLRRLVELLVDVVKANKEQAERVSTDASSTPPPRHCLLQLWSLTSGQFIRYFNVD